MRLGEFRGLGLPVPFAIWEKLTHAGTRPVFRARGRGDARKGTNDQKETRGPFPLHQPLIMPAPPQPHHQLHPAVSLEEASQSSKVLFLLCQKRVNLPTATGNHMASHRVEQGDRQQCKQQPLVHLGRWLQPQQPHAAHVQAAGGCEG